MMTATTRATSTWLRLLLGLALSILSAALLVLSMPPYGLWPLALIGLTPMLFAQYRILPRRAAHIAPAIGVGGFIGFVILSIFPNEMVNQYGYLKLVPLAVMAIVFLTESSSCRFHERTRYRWFVLEGALIWVGIEMIRGLIIGTGGFIGYAYYQAPWLIQPISIFGIYGLSLVTMLIAYTLALLVIALYDRATADRTPQPEWISVPMPLAARWAGGIATLSIVWVGLSLALFQTPAASTVRVAAVQPHQSNFPNLTRGTREAAAQGAKIIVWPEGALGFDLQVQKTAELKKLAIETGAYLVIGNANRTANGPRNEVTVLSPGGEFLGVYGKAHPVTYLGETSISHSDFPAFQTPLGVLGTIICYDLEFTDTARSAARNGAQLVAAPSNDWQSLYDKQYLMPVFRAVENRVAMIKADTQYDSVVVDAYGRIIELTSGPNGTRAIVVADVPLGTADAPQIILGDWIGWLSLAGMIIFSLREPLEKVWARVKTVARSAPRPA
jgi:apolipoprotein N-acyltransferase